MSEPSPAEYQKAVDVVDHFIAEMLQRHKDEFTTRCAEPHLAHAMQVLASSAPPPPS